eukprot:3927153-Pyramimonas_sp.AAC.1
MASAKKKGVCGRAGRPEWSKEIFAEGEEVFCTFPTFGKRVVPTLTPADIQPMMEAKAREEARKKRGAPALWEGQTPQ